MTTSGARELTAIQESGYNLPKFSGEMRPVNPDKDAPGMTAHDHKGENKSQEKGSDESPKGQALKLTAWCTKRGAARGKRAKQLQWKAIRMLSWIVLLCTITMAPVAMQYSYFGGESGRVVLKSKYTGPTAHTVSFVTSIFIGTIITALFYGKKWVKSIFNLRAIVLLAPVSVGYSISEALALTAMGHSDPIMYAVIHKMRLLLTAGMTRIFLRRSVSYLQWTICVTVTLAVLSFVFLKLEREKKDGKKEASDFTGPILLVVNILVSVACAIYADWSYKQLAYPLPAQMACGRITAALGSLVVAVVLISVKGNWKYGWFGGEQGGWDGRVAVFLFFLIFRDWVTCFVLQYLDALWKALAGSAAVATTYLVDLTMTANKFALLDFCMVLTIMFSVSIYAFVKITEKKMKELQNQVKELTKAAALAAGEAESPQSCETTV